MHHYTLQVSVPTEAAPAPISEANGPDAAPLLRQVLGPSVLLGMLLCSAMYADSQPYAKVPCRMWHAPRSHSFSIAQHCGCCPQVASLHGWTGHAVPAGGPDYKA